MKKVLLVKYGELALRENNRYLFEKRLIKTLRRNLKPLPYCRVIKEQGRILIEADEDIDFELIIPKIYTVLGIVGFCPCLKTENQELDN